MWASWLRRLNYRKSSWLHHFCAPSQKMSGCESDAASPAPTPLSKAIMSELVNELTNFKRLMIKDKGYLASLVDAEEFKEEKCMHDRASMPRWTTGWKPQLASGILYVLGEVSWGSGFKYVFSYPPWHVLNISNGENCSLGLSYRYTFHEKIKNESKRCVVLLAQLSGVMGRKTLLQIAWGYLLAVVSFWRYNSI